MKGKSLIVLILILVAVIGCSVIAAAYIVDGSGNTLELAEDGTPYEQEVTIENMLPGQEEKREYKSSVTGSGTFSVRFERGEVTDLNEYLTFTVVVGDEVLCSGAAEECFGETFTVQVSGEFSFSVSFAMPENVGNGAQGKVSEFGIVYTLEGGAQA